MTTTPAMPELPDTDYYLGFCDEGGDHLLGRRGYTADQMDARYLRGYIDALATLQAQPAEVSDATINRLVYEHTKLNPNQADDLDLLLGFRKAVRAILALRPQSVPMTEDTARLDWLGANPVCKIFNEDGEWSFDGKWCLDLRDAIDNARGITAPAGGEG